MALKAKKSLFKQNRFSRSLQLKLTTLFVSGIFIAVVLVGYISIMTLRSNLETEVEKNHMLLATAFGAHVEQYFIDAKGVVGLTAQLPAVRNLFTIPLIRDDLKGIPKDADRPKRDVINYVLERNRQFGYMEQVTGDGDNILIEPWEYQLELERLNFSDRDWFQNAIATGDTYISEVYVSSSLQKPVIGISHPIITPAGKVEAVWMGALTLDKLSELCLSLTFGETGHAYLVDQNGTLAAYKDFDMVVDMKDISTAPAVQKALRGETGTALLLDPFENKELLTSYMPVGETGWSIIVVQDPAEALAPVKSATFRIIVICVLLMVIAAVLAWSLARTISRPISNLALVAAQVAEGDLTTDINVSSKDEVGALAHAFGQMIDQMRNIVRDIMDRANMVASSSQQLNASSEETAANANEAAATMSQMSSTVQQVDASIQEVAAQSGKANEAAARGSQGMDRIIGQMQTIANSTSAVSVSVDDLNKKSYEINQIVSLITDIADQTNLLALNAAIEAARAGDQGRGFAVVAEEVRKLAEESADAAQEINILINAIQLESKKAVGIMADSAKEVETGTEVINEVKEDFAEIIDSVEDVTSQIREVVSATEQMAKGMQNIAASTEEQTAAMEEVSASAEALGRLSEELNGLVGRFKA